MIIVLDPCKLAFQSSPDGGILQINSIVGGFLDDTTILIPMGEGALEALDDEIKKRLTNASLDLSGDVSQAIKDQAIADELKGMGVED